MSVLQFLILLLSAASCCAAPRPENDKKCDRPDIKNGGPYYSYSFPKSPGSYIDYRCNQNYVSHQKEYWGRLLCTNFGWNPEPTCKRQCYYWKAHVENAEVSNLQSIYVEGEAVRFTCNSPFRTPDGKESGIRMCLPDGEFTTAKCSVQCTEPQLPHGEYIKSKKEYANNEYLQYTCNKGYMTEKRNLLAATQCVNGKWSENPKCIAITCNYGVTTYKDKTVMPYTCSRGKRPTSDLVQCFNYGWGPPALCQDIECTIPATLNLILIPHRTSYWFNAEVSFSCDKGFNRVGSPSSTCTENGWNPPLPSCQREKPGQPDTSVPSPDGDDKGGSGQKCARAHNPRNSEIIDLKEAYYSNDEVIITCIRGYKMYGSATIRCIDGKWEQPPECYRAVRCRSPPSIANGFLSQDSEQEEYVTDDVVKYKCKPGFHIIGSGEITCIGGQWSGSPECTEDSCEKTPKVSHAIVKEEKIYNHGESAEFTCDNNYGFFGGDSAKCVKGMWMNIPTCVSTSCNPPPAVPNSKINGNPKKTYATGEKVTYSCNNGYSFEKSSTGEAKCENTEWINVPVCRRVGEQCGTPPTVQFGDTTSIRKLSYKSGESVEYKCPNYFTLKGDQIVKCQNGVWGEAPVCLEPCTAKKKNMEENNIQLRWIGDEKLYTPHGGVTEFACKSGFESLPNTQMRIVCEHGKLEYPKCFRNGYCVLQQSEMLANNVHYYESTVVDNGRTITFQCNEEMMADKSLKATCTWGKIQYPKCTAAKPCTAPPLLHGKYIPRKNEFANGEYLQYECDKGYMTERRNLLATSQCLDGQWSEIPNCIAITCEQDSSLYRDESVISYTCPHGKRAKSDLVQCFYYGWGPPVICQEVKPGQPDATNPPPDNIEKEGNRQKCPLAHSPKNAEIIDIKEAYYSNDQVAIKCNKGYRMYGSATIRCIAGKWEQPPECYEIRDQCGSAPTIQFGDTIEMRKFSYRSGEFVEYQCQIYHVLKGEKIVKCLNGVWEEAPVCLEPCTATEDRMDENNIQLNFVGEKKIYLTHGEELEFKCIFGYEALPNTQMRIACKHGKLEYPNCLRKGFCILQPKKMIDNNIIYNESPVVEREQTIKFQCNEAMIPENGLEATCRLGNIQYPKCTAAKS